MVSLPLGQTREDESNWLQISSTGQSGDAYHMFRWPLVSLLRSIFASSLGNSALRSRLVILCSCCTVSMYGVYSGLRWRSHCALVASLYRWLPMSLPVRERGYLQSAKEKIWNRWNRWYIQDDRTHLISTLRQGHKKLSVYWWSLHIGQGHSWGVQWPSLCPNAAEACSSRY